MIIQTENHVSISQEKYDEIIKYIEGLKTSEGNSMFEIEGIRTIKGNPPVYQGIEILVYEPAQMEDNDKKKSKESLKGLIDILYNF